MSERAIVDVVLPVLDEAQSIPWVLDRMPADYRAIVVDNDSSDGSGDVARALGAVVVEEPVRGFGAACWAGLQAATAAVVCFMDCDCSLDPADLPRLVDELDANRAELVLGARRPERGAWPVHGRLANYLLAHHLRMRRNIPLTDLGPTRAARREMLVDLELRDRGSGWPVEMVVRAHAAGWRIGEVPVPYFPRVGRSKVTGTISGSLRAARAMAAQLRAIDRSVA